MWDQSGTSAAPGNGYEAIDRDVFISGVSGRGRRREDMRLRVRLGHRTQDCCTAADFRNSTLGEDEVTEPIHTTISVVQRTITQLLANGRTVRYTLAPASDGDVFWRQDTFAPADHPTQPQRWLSHQGPLTIAAVVAAVPQCRDAIRAWTQAEVDDSLAATDLDETARGRRAAAVTRLREQLDAPQDDPRAA